jgi:hypothetical protein
MTFHSVHILQGTSSALFSTRFALYLSIQKSPYYTRLYSQLQKVCSHYAEISSFPPILGRPFGVL